MALDPNPILGLIGQPSMAGTPGIPGGTPGPVGAPHGFGPGGPVTGALPPQTGFGGGAQGAHHDEQRAHGVIQHLMLALNGARDPNLRESLSNALAAIHKHLAGFQKERQDALAGKLSPRLLEMVHAGAGTPNGGGPMVTSGVGGNLPSVAQNFGPGLTPAQVIANAGNPALAAQTWINHHPYAYSHGHIPGFVQAWQAATTNAPAPGPTAQ